MYGRPQDKATDRYHDRLKEHRKELLTQHQHTCKLSAFHKKAKKSTVRVTVLKRGTMFSPLERED